MKSLRVGDGLVEIKSGIMTSLPLPLFLQKGYISELLFEELLARTHFSVWFMHFIYDGMYSSSICICVFI
jgi:hypothetical protein